MPSIRSTLLSLAALLLMAACRKSSKESNPPYQHRSLGDVEVKYLKPYSLDIDQDNEDEVYFVVGLVNDAEGTHARFTAYSLLSAKVLSREDSVLKQNEGDPVPVVPHHPHEWSAAANFMCELLLPAANPLDTTWRGDWVGVNRKYLGVQFMKGTEACLGWVAVSVDTANDRMVLHDCAWRPLKAGTVHAGKK